jgi:diaminopropionate ammonia-lyase
MDKDSAYFINQPSGRMGDSLTTRLLRQHDPLAFHQSLPGYAPTPCRRLDGLARYCGIGALWVKDESQRFGLQAFKALGASFAMQQLAERDDSCTTFCTATDGNHGRAVAWAAAQRGKKAVVYVPRHTVASRIAAIAQYGARVIVTERDYEGTCILAAEEAARNAWQLVQDTAWPGYEEIPALIMTGYLTHLKELEEQLHPPGLPAIDVVFLQSGVGSWAAAAAWYYYNRYPHKPPTLIIAEPEQADGLLESFKRGTLSAPAQSGTTIMAGLNCGIPSSTAWPILQQTIHAAMRIPDAAAARAMCLLYRPLPGDDSIESGESGAAGVAALLELMQNPAFAALRGQLGLNARSRVLCYNTEGSTDPENFKRILDENDTTTPAA